MAKRIRTITANWEDVLRLADQFSQSTRLLAAATSAALQGPETTIQLPHLIPEIVFRAFTIELLLKALALREQGSVHAVHAFTEIFSQLSEASKDEIEAHFEEIVAQDPMRQVMRAQAPQVSMKFSDVMSAMDRTFEQWRYVFDSNVQGAYGLSELERAVRNRFATLDASAAPR